LYGYFARSPRRKKALKDYLAMENAENIERRRRLEAEDRRVPPAHNEVNPVDALEDVLTVLLERLKLPRRIVMTRWLSTADAVRVVLNARDVYINFFYSEENDKASAILDLLEDSVVMAWYACLQDVLPVLTGLNVLFQSRLPLPHILYAQISQAKAKLMHMVGEGGTRNALIPLNAVDVNTKFGAYANKFIHDYSGVVEIRGKGSRLYADDILQLKKSWHKLFAHCLTQIDARFPPENMECFKLMQVLDPMIVHGPMLNRRNQIDGVDLALVVADLANIFEIPLFMSSCIGTLEDIKNSFTAFRASEVAATLWKDLTKKYTDEHPIRANTTARKKKKPFDYTVIYTYYRELLQMPDTKPWAFFALFILVFPTGNAISERGFSAMGASNSKQRSEMSHEQVFAHMIIGFNGPSTSEFATKIRAASKFPNWNLYIHPNNYN
jgi:hypothetical protein